MSAEITGQAEAAPSNPTHYVVGHPTCVTCRWWVEWSGESYKDGKISKRMGNCVRKSPRILTSNDGSGRERFHTKWPNTASDQFCGDYKPRVISAAAFVALRSAENKTPSSHE